MSDIPFRPCQHLSLHTLWKNTFCPGNGSYALLATIAAQKLAGIITDTIFSLQSSINNRLQLRISLSWQGGNIGIFVQLRRNRIHADTTSNDNINTIYT